MCSFQGTNCDNHSIMVIYGLKWTFPSDWRLSFSFTLWAQVDSNHRPHAYQACALTSWAMSPQWRIRDSNSWPPACKAGALPTELRPHIFDESSSACCAFRPSTLYASRVACQTKVAFCSVLPNHREVHSSVLHRKQWLGTQEQVAAVCGFLVAC